MYRYVAFLMLMVGTGLAALGLRISRGGGSVEVTGSIQLLSSGGSTAASAEKGDAGSDIVNPVMLVDPSKV